MRIRSVHALEILDSRGNPTVRSFVTLENGQTYSASVPSGASTGSHEALELRDGDMKRYQGLGVLNAITHVNTTIHDALKGLSIERPDHIDSTLLKLDGTENKERLGANAILSVSLALHRAAASYEELPLWRFLHTLYFGKHTPSFPRLMLNVVNGGRHANWNFDTQEFMIIPAKTTPSESLQMGSDIYHTLGRMLREKNLSPLVGDEGGYSPALSSNEQVLELIISAATMAGFTQESDYDIGLDLAASEWYKSGIYTLHKSGKEITQDELISYYRQLKEKFHIFSFEDLFAEDDWDSWQKITGLLKTTLFIGDDLYATNKNRLKKGIIERASNGILVKVNQIGTMLETAETINMARDSHMAVAISHRSGETEDSFIADLSYACGADFLKSGAPARSERLAKYNRLLEIEAGK